MQTRRLLPRWRSSEVSLIASRDAGLTRHLRSRADSRKVIREAQHLAKLWDDSPGVGIAADLLNLARFPEAQAYLVEPARFLLKQQTSLPLPLLRMATKIADASIGTVDAKPRETHRELANLRERLSLYPRDAIGWIDIARAYTILGSATKADKSVRTALQLAPNSRFVLRSAARFYAHVREHERAEYILRRSARTLQDPWLLATSISLQSILNRTDDAKRGLRMLAEKRFPPPDISELACALGTLELSQGKYKNSRFLLSQGLVKPNDNAVAQALWVVTTFSFPLEAREEWFHGKFAAEARVYNHYIAGNFEAALTDTLVWQEDEPFSSRPWVSASYVAALLEDWGHAVVLANAGLKNDPNDVALRNNLAYALMGKGDVRAATHVLYRLIKEEQKGGERVSAHTKANVAMRAYRTGDFELGERLYRAAFKDFSVRGNAGAEGAANVMANFAREAKLARAPNADEVVREAADYVKKHPWPSALLVLKKFNSTNDGMLAEPAKAKSLVNTQTKWHYDPEKNILILDDRTPFR